MKYQEFNQKIIALVGGKDNIQSVVHCMTRLRFQLKDSSKAKTDELKALDGVIDVISNNVAYQVVIGTHVNAVHAELISMLDLKGDEGGEQPKVKKNPFKAMLDLVSEIMTPVIEPIIGAGLLAGFLSVFTITGILPVESSTYVILNAIRESVFYFLPILIAMACAKRLGASPFLAVALAATLVSGSINGVEGLSIFGIPLPTSTYASSFIPIILAVWFMGKVTMFLQKRIPQFMQYFLNPVLILVICVPVTLLFFGPIGIWIGDGIGWFFGTLNDTIGSWIVVMLYAGLQPFIIMFGAGNFMMPLSLNFLNTLGYDPIFLGAATISDIAVSGAMLGYFLRARAAKQKQLFATVSFSAIMGVTEPAIYGAFVKFRRPFFAVMIGGGIGGLFAGLMQVKTYSMVWGLMGLPSYAQGEDFSNFGFMVASVVIGFVAAAIAAYILGIPAEKTKEATPVADDNNGKAVFSSVAEGELIPLASVKDPAFSTGTLGEGVGVIPSTDAVYAPFAGEVAVVFPTKHAFAIKADNGAEILIHIGIDTVNLNGQHFDTIVKQGDRVTQGQLLAKVDFAAVKAAGYDTTIIVIVSNTADYKAIEPAQAGTVTKDSEIFTVVK